MNGSLEIFERVFHSINGSNDRCVAQDVIERETFQIAAAVHDARSRNESSIIIGPHHCLDVLRALQRFCEVSPRYKYNKLIGYNLEW